MENVVFGCLVHKFIYKSVICMCWTSSDSERHIQCELDWLCDTTREIPNNKVERFMTTTNKSAARIGEKNNGETHQRPTITYTHVFCCDQQSLFTSNTFQTFTQATSFNRSYKIKNEMQILMPNRNVRNVNRIYEKISINS